MINGWPFTQGTVRTEWGGSHFTGVVSLHKFFEILEILTPVIVGVSDIVIAHAVATPRGVKVREVTRERYHWDGDDREHDEAEEKREKFPGDGIILVASIEVSERECHQEVQKGKYREEVTESDREVPGNADVSIKQDKEYREILHDSRPKGMNQKETKWLCTRHETMAEVKESDRGGDHKEKEEGQSRFEEEDNGEVGFFRIDTHVS